MNKIISYFAGNRLVVNVFILVVFAGGLFFSSSLRREMFPNVDIKMLTITTVYPGAAPQDVELNVSKKIEDELGKVDGLEKFISTSSENMSLIQVWIDLDEKDPESVKQEIRNAVDRAETEFPSEAKKPVITENKTEMTPILHFLITSSSLSEKELREAALQMEDVIKESEGVSGVTKNAYRDAEIKILADIEKMKDMNISLDQINKSVKSYNIRSGGGSLQSLTDQKSIVTMTQFKNLDEVREVILRSNFSGQRVKIKDIGEVKDDYAEREIYARGNQQNGILLLVTKKENADIIRTADDVKKRVEEFAKKLQNRYALNKTPQEMYSQLTSRIAFFRTVLKKEANAEHVLEKLGEFENEVKKGFSGNSTPIFSQSQRMMEKGGQFRFSLAISSIRDEVKKEIFNKMEEYKKEYFEKISVLKVMDLTIPTRSMLNIVFNNAIFGFILVFLTLLVALSFRAAFWTAFGIPTALMMTFFLMKLAGFSINTVSLFGIITVLGILVDDGIVVAENIHKYHLRGITGVKGAVLATQEVFVPILGAVLTTVLAFLPLAFMGGIMGEFLYQLPMMVIFALLASLIEVFIALPCHLSHSGKKKVKEKKEGKISKALISGYKKLLFKSLRYRYLILFFFILLLLGSFKILKSMDFVLFSNKEADEIYLLLEGEQGLSLDEMLERSKKMESAVIQEIPYDKEMDALVTTVGNGAGFNQIEPNQKNKSKIQIKLVPYSDRKRTAAEIVESLKVRISKNSELTQLFKKIVLKEKKPGPPVGSPIEVKIISHDDGLRKEFAAKLKDFLQKQPGVFSIEDDSENTKKEIQLQFNYEDMYRLGVNPLVVASTVRMGFNGETVTSISRSKEDIDVVIQLQEKYRYNIGLLKKLLIPTSYQGKQIRLEQIASFPVAETQSSVIRYNGKRAITITGEIDLEKNNAAKIMALIQKDFLPLAKEYPQVQIQIGGEGEKSAESVQDTAKAFLLAIFGIFIILLLIFRSVSQPLLVLAAIPFGLIGVILAFKIHGEPFGFFGMVGAVGLAGVVVNDSIVMVDFMNRLISSMGTFSFEKLKEKITEGAGERLNAVLLTTVTTIAGVLPTVYGVGGSNPMVRPLTMALAYGLLFGTTITLFLLPNIFLIEKDIKQLIGKLKSKIRK